MYAMNKKREKRIPASESGENHSKGLKTCRKSEQNNEDRKRDREPVANDIDFFMLILVLFLHKQFNMK